MPKIVSKEPSMPAPAFTYQDKIKVWQGDCVDIMNQLPEGKIQTAICSPPYWSTGGYGNMPWKGGSKDCDHSAAVVSKRGSKPGARQYFKYALDCPTCGAKQDRRRVGAVTSLDQYVEQMVKVGEALHRILRDDGTWWLNLDDSYDTKGSGLPAGNRVMAPARVAIALQESGWIMRQDIIYSKIAPFFESVKNRCTRSHEYIFLMTKSKNGYYYDAEAIREGNHNRLSVWRINHKGYKGSHYGTFPSSLVEPCIMAGSKPGDIVFDPFMGSGTTLINAFKMGRKGWGTELVEKHLHEESIPNLKSMLEG